MEIACFALYEDVEIDRVLDEEPEESETMYLVPLGESDYYVYVCAECGSELTDIPYYNRFFCGMCGLHY